MRIWNFTKFCKSNKRKIEYYPKSISRFETNCQKRSTIQIFLLSTLNNISRISFTGICRDFTRKRTIIRIFLSSRRYSRNFSNLFSRSILEIIEKLTSLIFPLKISLKILFHLTVHQNYKKKKSIYFPLNIRIIKTLQSYFSSHHQPKLSRNLCFIPLSSHRLNKIRTLEKKTDQAICEISELNQDWIDTTRNHSIIVHESLLSIRPRFPEDEVSSSSDRIENRQKPAARNTAKRRKNGLFCSTVSKDDRVKEKKNELKRLQIPDRDG